MAGEELSRLSRLTAILLRLQAGRLVTAPALAESFSVSVRTIYRDIRTLEQAGVPIATEEGKGYRLLPGYRLPPVMFTEREAAALITAELLVKSARDSSLIADFSAAIAKLKAVLTTGLQEKTERLEAKTGVSKTYLQQGPRSSYLADIQQAMVNYTVIEVAYTNRAGECSRRSLEPFAVFSTRNDEWVVIAYCRLRLAFRTFSLASISELWVSGERFTPHPMSLAEYLGKEYGN